MSDVEDVELARFHVNTVTAHRGRCVDADVASLIDSFEGCRLEGAAVAFGLMGMAEAIHARELAKLDAIALQHFSGDPYDSPSFVPKSAEELAERGYVRTNRRTSSATPNREESET